MVENALWAHDSWPQFLGRAASPLQDTSFERFTLNYAHDAMYRWILSGTTRDGKAVLFTANTSPERERKQLNFYRAFAYIKHYPEQNSISMQSTLGCSYGVFYQQVLPTLHSIAQHMSFLEPAPLGVQSHEDVCGACHFGR